MKNILLISFVFFCLVCSIFGQHTLTLNNETVQLSGKISYIEDRTNQLTIDAIQRVEYLDKFQTLATTSPNFGFTPYTYWFRIQIQNQNPYTNEYITKIGYPQIRTIEFYLFKDDQLIQQNSMGRKYEFKQRIIQHRHFIIPFALKKLSSYTIYFKIETDGSLQFPLSIMKVEDFIKEEQDTQIWYGFYYGSMIVMLFYNLFVYFTVKDKNYLYYVAYVLTFIFFQAALDGHGYQYIWTNFPKLASPFIPMSVASACISTLFFTKNYLNIDSNYKKINRTFKGMIGLLVIVLLYSAIGDYTKGTKAMAGLTIIVAILSIFSGIYFVLQKNKLARLYLFAWFALLTGSVIFAMNKFGLIPHNTWTENSAQIGSLIEILMLSFALADKMKRLTEEKEKTTRELAESKLKTLEYFSNYVPRQFLKFLNKDNIFEIKLGEAVRSDITVVFAAISKFDSLSKDMTPEEIFAFINRYLEIAGPIIQKHNGFIDKYIGNIIMALFPKSPEDALLASIEINKVLVDINKKRIENNEQIIELSIGIHTGELMLGTIGNIDRMDTTVIGDTVNLASRIQYLTIVYNVPIMLSSITYYRLSNPSLFSLKEIESIKVKGKTEPILIFGIENPIDVFNKIHNLVMDK